MTKKTDEMTVEYTGELAHAMLTLLPLLDERTQAAVLSCYHHGVEFARQRVKSMPPEIREMLDADWSRAAHQPARSVQAFPDCQMPDRCGCAERGYEYERDGCAVPSVRAAADLLGFDIDLGRDIDDEE